MVTWMIENKPKILSLSPSFLNQIVTNSFWNFKENSFREKLDCVTTLLSLFKIYFKAFIDSGVQYEKFVKFEGVYYKVLFFLHCLWKSTKQMLSHCFQKVVLCVLSIRVDCYSQELIVARRQGITKFVWNNTDIKNVARNVYFFLASPETSFGVIMCDKWTPKDVCGEAIVLLVKEYFSKSYSQLLFKWVHCLTLINFLLGLLHVDNRRGWADTKWGHKTKIFKM